VGFERCYRKKRERKEEENNKSHPHLGFFFLNKLQKKKRFGVIEKVLKSTPKECASL
jgi:hypothetical protein